MQESCRAELAEMQERHKESRAELVAQMQEMVESHAEETSALHRELDAVKAAAVKDLQVPPLACAALAASFPA